MWCREFSATPDTSKSGQIGTKLEKIWDELVIQFCRPRGAGTLPHRVGHERNNKSTQYEAKHSYGIRILHLSVIICPNFLGSTLHSQQEPFWTL
jgi:hypothetical protein